MMSLPQNVRVIVFAAEYAATANSCHVSSAQRNAAQYAAEAADVEHRLARTHHQLGRAEAGSASGASLRREKSVTRIETAIKIGMKFAAEKKSGERRRVANPAK